jgi:hypothetical protein
MRTATVVCLAAAVVSLASCSRHAEGTLDGQVKMYGGPATNGRQALNGEPGADWQVTVSAGSRIVAETTSDSAGRFTFRLAPGICTLCSNPQPVTVRAGTVTTADCIASVP